MILQPMLVHLAWHDDVDPTGDADGRVVDDVSIDCNVSHRITSVGGRGTGGRGVARRSPARKLIAVGPRIRRMRRLVVSHLGIFWRVTHADSFPACAACAARPAGQW
jgi:hypothetical protein